MTKVVVLGANGQVGAEVCLLLEKHADVTVIPVCRNPGSSSFLRYHGLACRHGIPADPEQARELLADADVVLNFAFVRGLPSATRRVHEDLIANSFRCSPADARVIFISTLSVYGFPTALGFRRNTAYGREKLFCEEVARREGARAGKPVTIFRLGHVCGDLQAITARIRSEVESGPLELRQNGDYPSNTTYTATLVEAVQLVIAERVAPGTHDLVRTPERSWREVYAYEADQVGAAFRQVERAVSASPGPFGRAVAWLGGIPRRAAGVARSSVRLRDLTRTLVSRLPGTQNRRLNAIYNRSRARAEIAALTRSGVAFVRLADPWPIRRALDGLSDPAELRRDPRYQLPEEPAGFRD